jgi:hypothetical protein
MTQFNFTLIINLITDKSIDRTIAALGQEKINFSPAVKDGKYIIADPDYLGAGLCLYLDYSQEADIVASAIQDILDKNNIKYFSICVIDTVNNNISWAQSNIQASAQKINNKKKIKKVPYLRLVPTPQTEEIA